MEGVVCDGGQESSRSADPFGRTVSERLWRRLAGAGIAVTLAAGWAVLTSPQSLAIVLIGTTVVMALGVPVSWAMERRSGRQEVRWTVLRHAGAGAIVGLLVGLSFGLPGGRGWLLVWLLFSVPIGTLVGGVAAWAGLSLPQRWVRPIAVGGLMVAAAIPFGVWLEQRPPAPYDFVIVEGTPAVERQFGGPEGLAAAIAQGFDRQAAAGRSRTAHSTWVSVAEDVITADLQPWVHYEADEGRPRLKASGEPARLVTVIVRDSAQQACVVVTSDASRVEPQPCSSLAIV